MAETLIESYTQGLRELLQSGEPVPSVLGRKSKASNFGAGDRPWLELRGYKFEAPNPEPTIFSATALPTHIPYTLGLLAWTLDARDDVETLAYYRASALDFSDDGRTMCGAFGARLSGAGHDYDQLAAIADRIRDDGASRRTYAAIIQSSDNLIETLEYPCAAGVQLFLRNEELHWITFMRAQQALTVLPYDCALFSMLQHFYASALGVSPGRYSHISGTYHIYENERDLAAKVLGSTFDKLALPLIPPGSARDVALELINIEAAVRAAAQSGRHELVREIGDRSIDFEFNRVALEIFVNFGVKRIASS